LIVDCLHHLETESLISLTRSLSLLSSLFSLLSSLFSLLSSLFYLLSSPPHSLRSPHDQTDVSAAWRIVRYSDYSPQLQRFLTSGAVIRLLHTEDEAHLTVADDNKPYKTIDDFITRYRSDYACYLRQYESKDGVDKISALSLWEVEQRDRKAGGPIAWDKNAASDSLVSVPVRWVTVQLLLTTTTTTTTATAFHSLHVMVGYI
jgi:hypothetical protein